MSPEFQADLDNLPHGDWFDAPTARDAWWMARIELDLIDEGQEAAECYTPVEVILIRRFVKKWEHKLT